MEIGDQVLRQQDWLFHRLTPFYDYLIRRPRADRLRDLLDLPANGVMVDVGGGTGRVAPHFSGLTANVLVCDINRSMLKQARRKKALLPLQADAEDLPFPADTHLPPGGLCKIETLLRQQKNIVAGSFSLSFDYPSPFLRLYAQFSRINHILFTYGDQDKYHKGP